MNKKIIILIVVILLIVGGAFLFHTTFINKISTEEAIHITENQIYEEYNKTYVSSISATLINVDGESVYNVTAIFKLSNKNTDSDDESTEANVVDFSESFAKDLAEQSREYEVSYYVNAMTGNIVKNDEKTI